MKSGILVGLTAALLLSSAVARADVEISSKPTANMSCDAGVCTATAQKAVLNVSDLANMLASGDVAVKTGLVAKDIDIDQPLTWSSTGRLTLDAQQSVTVTKQVTVAGTGALTVTTNDTGAKAKTKAGEFIIVPERGSVQFWDLSSSLIIDGNSYTLVGDIKTLATDIAANPSGFYALAKPYDASGDGTYSEAPIEAEFFGMFDGLGNAVSKLSMNINGDTPAGLFAVVQDEGTVRDIYLQRAKLVAQGDIGGGLLVGGNWGNIIHCGAGGTFKFAIAQAGGLVGYNSGTISRSMANAKLRGSAGGVTYVGGLVGGNAGNVDSSFSLGSIVYRRGGGLVRIGGLIGDNAGLVRNSFARNSLTSTRHNDGTLLGGLVGQNESGAGIRFSYAAGSIEGSVGELGGVIGFDAAEPGSAQNVYWDLDKGVNNPQQGAANIIDDPGLTGLSDAQLKLELPDGFDPKVWGQNPKTNMGYPYLLNNRSK